MSFKSAIANIKHNFFARTKEDILHKLTQNSFERNVLVGGKNTPCLVVDMKPGTDIDEVQKFYEKAGIKLNQTVIKAGPRNRKVLYIPISDFEKLDKKLQDFFKRTTTKEIIRSKTVPYLSR